jgi:anaerobic magnesium-protoporphyrin IX monomethyl ester cyclase
MSGKVVLITPARRFISNRFGLGYQVPLGLVYIGGPLIDAGYSVKLIDNDLYGWSLDRLTQEIAAFNADYALLGHTGSTAAHATSLATIRAIRKTLPEIRIVYGGVYPSYADKSTMQECPAIDAIVRGEGEQTTLDLLSAWEMDRDAGKGAAARRSYLATVQGVTWRDGETVVANPPRPAIQNLDNYRPGFELVDWPGYSLFGFGPAAGLQFSRGCPLTCSYCGQWMFWKKWRHHSPEKLVAQLTELVETYGVKFVWFADENFSAERETTQTLLELIRDAKLDISLNLNMTAADVVRDADLLPLYKAAGVDYIVMGIESLEDSVIAGVRKNNPYTVSREAVRLLRENNIISLTNLIYGLEQESWGTLWAKFRKLLEFDADILNACYITPHFWTSDGKATDPADVIQLDMSKWTYRNQVVVTRSLTPLALFAGVKLTEALFHLRPNALLRLFTSPDARYRKIMRQSVWVGVKVILAEIVEFFWQTHFSPRGSLEKLYGTANSIQSPIFLPLRHQEHRESHQ